jgi:glyoxylase I family protein
MGSVFVPSTDAAIVRYQVTDVDRSLAFYTEQLGFRLVQRTGPITIIARGDLHILLSGPGASGNRPMPDGTKQTPGGWNRIVLYVENLDSSISTLQRSNAHLRSAIETGPGGRQIVVDDPDGNPIELHEAPNG